MTVGISLDELLMWAQESSNYWKAHLDANPMLLELHCGIGRSANVQEFVRHIWGVDLRWAQRLADEPIMAKEDMPAGPLDALFALHLKAVEIFRDLLAAPAEGWDAIYVLDIPAVSPEMRGVSRRKVALHALLHSQRHWAQLATLVRNAGHPSKFGGDLLFSRALS